MASTSSKRQLNVTEDDNMTTKKTNSDAAAVTTPTLIGETIETKNVQNNPQITFESYTNDNTDRCSVALISLKNIFSRQLPKMPREYISRLVFDRRHISFAIKSEDKIIGGICYRPYAEQKFGEIAFCAISGTEQVKGFGTMLMNNLKKKVQIDGIEYFLTYADNYAIGYFQKQGFSKVIAMPKERWVGYIKDYDGGTLMECYIHPGIDYTNISGIIANQRAYIQMQLAARSQSNKSYPGLELFKQGKRLTSVLEAPGVAAAGWTNQHLYKGATERDRNMALSKLTSTLTSLINKIKLSPFATDFLGPVSDEDAADYAEKVKNPLDLSLIHKRLREEYYRSKDMLRWDLIRMVENCKSYNGKDSSYYSTACNLEAVIYDVFDMDGTTASNVLIASSVSSTSLHPQPLATVVASVPTANSSISTKGPSSSLVCDNTLAVHVGERNMVPPDELSVSMSHNSHIENEARENIANISDNPECTQNRTNVIV